MPPRESDTSCHLKFSGPLKTTARRLFDVVQVPSANSRRPRKQVFKYLGSRFLRWHVWCRPISSCEQLKLILRKIHQIKCFHQWSQCSFQLQTTLPPCSRTREGALVKPPSSDRAKQNQTIPWSSIISEVHSFFCSVILQSIPRENARKLYS